MKLKRVICSLSIVFSMFSSTLIVYGKNVIITGESIGITLNTSGTIVAKVTEENSDPQNTEEIQKGDIIVKVNGEKVKDTYEIAEALAQSNGENIITTVNRNGVEISMEVTPVLNADGSYHPGVWARDGVSGIGTLTYYDPQNGEFGALGHAVSNSTTGKPLEICGGKIAKAEIVSLKKGEKGNPGELSGLFSKDALAFGTVEKNTACGIFGKLTNSVEQNEAAREIKTGTKADVREGKAYILTCVEGSQSEKFEIEIVDIPKFGGDVTKGMVIEITDNKLLEKTGGIVRGMSGSPIVQGGRLVGAVTHVFVNNPKMGYGIFIEDMLKESQK